MSWEKEDSLRRKVRTARERRAFKDSVEIVLSAKEGQEAVRMQREAEQTQLPQPVTSPGKHLSGQEPHKSSSRIIRHVRDGRSEREP